MKPILKLLIVLVTFLSMHVAANDSEVIVGKVAGVDITADVLKKARSPGEVFVKPAMAKYFETRRALVTPTKEELAVVEANVRGKIADMAKEGNTSLSNSDPALIAKFLLVGWKYNTYLYKHFGGGRLLFQQAGVEAFDATHEFLKHLEREKYFEIADESVRAEVFAYWNREHGSFIMDDEEVIEKWLDIRNLGR